MRKRREEKHYSWKLLQIYCEYDCQNSMFPPSAAAETGECFSLAAACCVVPMSSGAKYHAWGSLKHADFLNSHPSEYPRPGSFIYSLSAGRILPQFPIPVRDLVSSDGRILSVLSVMSAFPRTSAARRQQRGHGALQDLPRLVKLYNHGEGPY